MQWCGFEGGMVDSFIPSLICLKIVNTDSVTLNECVPVPCPWWEPMDIHRSGGKAIVLQVLRCTWMSYIHNTRSMTCDGTYTPSIPASSTVHALTKFCYPCRCGSEWPQSMAWVCSNSAVVIVVRNQWAYQHGVIIDGWVVVDHFVCVGVPHKDPVLLYWPILLKWVGLTPAHFKCGQVVHTTSNIPGTTSGGWKLWYHRWKHTN